MKILQKSDIENSDAGHFLEIDVKNDLPYLSEIMKIGKFEKLVCSFNCKKNHVVNIRIFTIKTKPLISSAQP